MDGRELDGRAAAQDGSVVFELVDPATLNYCYTETGSDFLTICAHLTKQK